MVRASTSDGYELARVADASHLVEARPRDRVLSLGVPFDRVAVRFKSTDLVDDPVRNSDPFHSKINAYAAAERIAEKLGIAF
jgi:hypothetical protein